MLRSAKPMLAMKGEPLQFLAEYSEKLRSVFILRSAKPMLVMKGERFAQIPLAIPHGVRFYC
jgi:hypothetical protein